MVSINRDWTTSLHSHLECPSSTATGAPVLSSHTRTVLSSDDDASSVFELLTARSVMLPTWPRSVNFKSPVSRDQILISLVSTVRIKSESLVPKTSTQLGDTKHRTCHLRR